MSGITPEKLRACQASATRNHTWAPIMVQDCPMLADAMEIADSCARSDIECNVLGRHPDKEKPQVFWYDLATVAPDDLDAIAQSVRYLEARGILVRLSAAPHIVSFKDPNE